MGERPGKYPEEPTQSSQPEKIQQTADPRPHSVVLDALRGIALLGIVVTHAKTVWDKSTPNSLSLSLSGIDLFESYTNLWGVFGLTLFFLLSGYLLTWTEGTRASRGNYRLRSYAFRRALRLIPAYYAALAFIFLLRLAGLKAGGDLPTLTHTLVYLGVFQSFWPEPQPSMGFDATYWYLTSEVVFYALLPIVVLKIRGLYGRLVLFGALVAVAAVTDVFIYMSFSADAGFLPYYLGGLPSTHLWIFMAGVLLRTFVERLEVKRPGDSWPTLAFSLFAGSLAFVVLLPFGPLLEVSHNIGIHPMTVLFFAAFPFFVAAVLGSPVLSRVLSWRLLGFVGVISYSFYLLHTTFLMLAGGLVLRSRLVKPVLKYLHGPELWIAFAGYLGVMLVVIGAIAYLSYRYIESPFLRYKPK